jgi:threonine synthase
LKVDGQNPTGSFKDRGMTVAVTRAVSEGAEAIICASTGNTSASAAAYAARAGIRAYVVVPQGKIALGKLSQAVMHGARVIQIDGNFDQALTLVRNVKERYPTRLSLVNSVNPDRVEGQKTAAFEICDALGRAPDYHFLPVGNAGNITAYWKGYCEYHAAGIVERRPRMMGFEAAGAAPLVLGRVVENPKTLATAIRIGNPASWHGAVAARDESGGSIDAIDDDGIVAAYRLLARTEGIFAEPASAISVAGALKLGASGRLRAGDLLVLTLTGHGLKDPDTAIASSEAPLSIPNDLERLAAVLELG